MKPRGMHDIATAQSLINRSVPATRAQMVAQLARMEHERERLERELNVWAGKQKQTEGRLQQVRRHITLLQGALNESSAAFPESYPERSRRGSRRDRRPPSAEGSSEDSKQEATTWQEIALEY